MKIKLKDVREFCYADPYKNCYVIRYDLRFNTDYIITILKDLPYSDVAPTKHDIKKSRTEALQEINKIIEDYEVKEINEVPFPNGNVQYDFMRDV